MSINNYLARLEQLIASFPLVSAYNLTIDRKTEDIAFISGTIEFRDGTALDFKEFLESKESGVEKYKYAYNCRTHSGVLFRYDNSPDPRAKGLKTFPYHKHLKGGKIIESQQIGLKDVLAEIEENYNLNEE